MRGIPPAVLRVAEDIRSMRIRGAGNIARAAAKALVLAAREYRGADLADFVEYMRAVAEVLGSTRPTAVSLFNAISYVMSRLERSLDRISSVAEAVEVVASSGEEFVEYSRRAVELIGEIGAKRISDGDVVLTHCNSSAAISVLVRAHEQGKELSVYATETRPRMQGYLTARTLAREGIDVVLIPDTAVRLVMKEVDKVVVGADTVTANGAVVNKLGTSLIALAAKEANVNFFVAAETYKFSPATVVGELVIIEERGPEEVVPREYLIAHPRVRVRNPAFDITPPEYIDAIITEKGLIPPQAAILVLKEEYGRAIEDYMLYATQALESDEDVASAK